MALWQWIVDGLLVVLVVMLVLIVALFIRRRLIARGGGTFELSVNERPPSESHRSGRGWTLGVGRYSGESLEWFRAFSLRTKPTMVLDRRQLEVLGRRAPEGAEGFALYTGHVIVECRRDAVDKVQLALSPQSLTGLLSWIESSPPGLNSNRVI